AIARSAIVPTASGRLVTLAEGLWDEVGLFGVLGEAAMRRVQDWRALHLADRGLEEACRLVGRGLAEAKVDDMEAVLRACAPELARPEACLRAIAHLKQAVGQQPRALDTLKRVPWLPDGEGELRAGQDVYLPPQEGLLAPELARLGLAFHHLHPTIAAAPDAVSWLAGVGVRPFSQREFLRGSVVTAIKAGRVTEANAVAIGRFVFACRGLLEASDMAALRQLPLRTTSGGLAPAAEAWLASAYEPAEDLEGLLAGQAGFSFVDPCYVGPTETASDWRVFLRKLGVNDAITIHILDDVERATLEAQGEVFKAYLKHLDTHCYDAIYFPYRYQHVVNQFPHTPVLGHLREPAIAKRFWAAVVPQWGKQLFESDYLVNRRTRTVRVPSFVRYLLEHEAVVPTSAGDCRRAREVYLRTPRLEALVGDTFPLTDLEGPQLTVAQAKEIGLKTDLNLFDAMTLLERIAEEPWSDAQRARLDQIYGWLAKAQLTELGEQKVREWAPRARFLAQDGEFRPAAGLSVVLSDKRLRATAPERCMKFHGKPEHFSRAAAFFALTGVRVLADADLSVALEGAEEQAGPRLAVQDRVPLLALVRPDLVEPLPEAIDRMAEALAGTRFIQCRDSLVEAGAGAAFTMVDEAWLEDCRLCYRGDWQAPLTRYATTGPLCALLRLSGQERRVELLLSLSVAEGLAWLAGQGLDVSDARLLLAAAETAPGTPEAEDEAPDPDHEAEASADEPAGFELWTPEFDADVVPLACAVDDFSLTRSEAEREAFSKMLQQMLAREGSRWGGWVYHVTHLENVLAILASGTLLPRARAQAARFKDAAGQRLIHQTREEVKGFARFYFRPLTPTQWHNECLGRRRGDIVALCPVPVFLRVDLADALRAHGAACAVSNGNLAAAASRYGNSAAF
ncbi:MAG: DarT ssDNA thymidine ADP-ribosyltransferase family protein, partial [Candidatus Sericytochromatia bacterium]|nr:DarT ssDNA thymidine ADP-ribosyltransferase family protein [Candidatus Sericytochromatia bacterium]